MLADGKRRLLRNAARLVALLIVAGVAALLVRLDRSDGLSAPRLAEALRHGTAVAAAWASGRGLPVVALAIGAVAGWLCGSWRTRARLRRRSLLLLDPRGPDMPFMDGVRHVHSHAAQSSDESAAAALLLAAAQHGRLSLWHGASPEFAYRVSRRQLRRLDVQRSLGSLSKGEMAVLTPLSFVRAEVEKLWPSHPAGRPPTRSDRSLLPTRMS